MGLFDELYPQSDASQERRMFSVTTGKVVKNWDSKHPGMVQVELFMSESGKNRTDWVRVAQPYAGKERGIYFLPEVGDEVVLAFNEGDRDHPIVIGSLWGKTNTFPKGAPGEKNEIKTIRTQSGCEVTFSDKKDKESIQIRTKGGLTVILEDESKTVTIRDGNKKNLVTVNGKDGAVTVKASKKLVLDVGSGSLTLDGQGKKATLKMGTISIEAGQSLTLKGQNVKLEGSMAALKASGNMEVKAGGVLTLKGSMAKIN
jgi:uncharacterized protein involved in type VI secretion and phage assembly